VERWLRDLSAKRIRRGRFASVKEMKRVIQEYLDENNKQPKPFI